MVSRRSRIRLCLVSACLAEAIGDSGQFRKFYIIMMFVVCNGEVVMSKRKLKVVQILGRMMSGGVESTILNHCELLNSDKVELYFVAQDDSTYIPRDRISRMGGTVSIVPSYKHLPQYMKACRELFSDIRPDIVHSNMNALSCFPLKAAKDCGVPVRIAHSHSTASKGEGVKNLAKDVLRPFATMYPTHLMACSEAAGRWLFGNPTVDAGKVHILRNAINLEKFSFSQVRRENSRTALGISPDQIVFGQIGRFAFQKNQEFTLRVFSQLIEQGHDAVLLLIGDGDDRLALERESTELGLDRRVRFLGIRDDVDDLLQAMDVMFFPSRYEGLGMVAVEAQATGCPVLASTEVPREAAIVPVLFTQLSLDASPAEWARKAWRLAEEGRNTRCSHDTDARMAGYDLLESSRQLLKWYQQFFQEES